MAHVSELVGHDAAQLALGQYPHDAGRGRDRGVVSGYTPEALQNWTEKIQAWSEGRDAPGIALTDGPAPARASRDVYVYFDNDVKTHAPFDAMSLAHRLGLAPAPPPMPAPPRKRSARAVADSVPRTRWPGYGSRVRRRNALT